ncbi:MAG: NTP transferase domain-containing protein [Candidatus Zixiibacteriota bacterium]|nr:MAG: NTP transferase domain-containing protein [candidate division Zixibacteria bacterium]
MLAGGEGRRLLPYSRVLPKSLWPVGDVPIVEILIRQLARAGIKEVIMAVGYQAELIRIILGDGSQFGIKIRYVHEKKPLGTAAPLKRITRLDRHFLVLNGDLLTDLPFRIFGRTHLKNDSYATVAVFNRSVKIDFGVVEIEDDVIDQYLEKPSLRYSVSMGIYAFDREILRYIPNGRFDFPDLVDILIVRGRNPSVYRFKGHWLDIGRPDDWERADRLFRRQPRLFLR